MAVLVAVLVAAGAGGGCQLSSEERVAAVEQAVTYLQGESVQFDLRLAAIQAVIASSRTALGDPNVTGAAAEQIRATMDEATAELGKVSGVKAKVDLVMADLQTKLAAMKAGGTVDVEAELKTAAAVLGTIGGAIGGATGGWLQAISAVLIALVSALPGLLVARSRGAKLSKTETALQEVVAGGERFKDTAATGIAQWKEAMTVAQKSEATRELVAVARARMK